LQEHKGDRVSPSEHQIRAPLGFDSKPTSSPRIDNKG
jgi:hypothetical protein